MPIPFLHLVHLNTHHKLCFSLQLISQFRSAMIAHVKYITVNSAILFTCALKINQLSRWAGALKSMSRKKDNAGKNQSPTSRS